MWCALIFEPSRCDNIKKYVDGLLCAQQKSHRVNFNIYFVFVGVRVHARSEDMEKMSDAAQRYQRAWPGG